MHSPLEATVAPPATDDYREQQTATLPKNIRAKPPGSTNVLVLFGGTSTRQHRAKSECWNIDHCTRNNLIKTGRTGDTTGEVFGAPVA